MFLGGENVLGLILEMTTSPATSLTAVDFTWVFVKMLLALVFVSVLAVVILKYFVPKLTISKRFRNNRQIEIIARHSLDHKKHLYIVRVGKKHVLIGAADNGVSKIMDLTKEDL